MKELTFDGELAYLQSEAECETWVREVAMKENAFGFDMEWRTTSDDVARRTALLQLCTPTNCALVHVAQGFEPPESLRFILEICDFLKAGVGIKQDFEKLTTDFDIQADPD